MWVLYSEYTGGGTLFYLLKLTTYPWIVNTRGGGGGLRMGVVRSGEMINDKKMGRIITSRGQTTEIPTIKENYWYSQST